MQVSQGSARVLHVLREEMCSFFVIVGLVLLVPVCCQDCINGTVKNYTGRMAKTYAGLRCLSWASPRVVSQLEKVLQKQPLYRYFPESSLEEVQNFCRSPIVIASKAPRFFQEPFVYNWTLYPEYLQLHEVGVTFSKALRFSVRTHREIYILLQYNSTDFSENNYEVLIGGGNGTVSAIRRGWRTAVVHIEPGILSEYEFRDFWIHWNSTSLRVGKSLNVGTGTFLHLNEAMYDVKHISVASGWSSGAEWEVVTEINKVWCYIEQGKSLQVQTCDVPRCEDMSSINTEENDCFNVSNEVEELLYNDTEKDICESTNNRIIIDDSKTTIRGCEGCTCCQRKDCYTDAKLYNGTWSRTLSGRACQRWDQQTPHSHTYNRTETFPMDGSVYQAHNYCRDLVFYGQPWCFTSDPDTVWGVCGIPPCDESGQVSVTEKKMWTFICVLVLTTSVTIL